MAYDKEDWRRGYSLVFTAEWRSQDNKGLSTVERLAHIISRMLHGNFQYKHCDHCIEIARAMYFDLKGFFELEKKNG